MTADPHTLDEYLTAVRSLQGARYCSTLDIKRAVWGAETGKQATAFALSELVEQGRIRKRGARYEVVESEKPPACEPVLSTVDLQTIGPGEAAGAEPCTMPGVDVASCEPAYDLPDVPDPPSTPAEILDPDVLRPEDPAECGADAEDDEDDGNDSCADPNCPECTDDDDPPIVCPGCHAVGEDPCAPGCIDAEIEEERRDAIYRGDYDTFVDDEEEPDLTEAEIREHLPDGGAAFDADVPSDPPVNPEAERECPVTRGACAIADTTCLDCLRAKLEERSPGITAIRALAIVRRESGLRDRRPERIQELRAAVSELNKAARTGIELLAELGAL